MYALQQFLSIYPAKIDLRAWPHRSWVSQTCIYMWIEFSPPPLVAVITKRNLHLPKTHSVMEECQYQVFWTFTRLLAKTDNVKSGRKLPLLAFHPSYLKASCCKKVEEVYILVSGAQFNKTEYVECSSLLPIHPFYAYSSRQEWWWWWQW